MVRKEQSLNSLISTHLRRGELQKALKMYITLPEANTIDISDRTYVALLKACATLKDIRSGFALHTQVARLGLVEENVFVGSTLVDMYAKCGLMEKAQEVFKFLPVPNIVSWTALMLGFAENGHEDKALLLFEQMQHKGVLPNAVTLLCGLKACSTIGAIKKGRDLHAEIARQGLIIEDLAIGNALVTMYSKCGCLIASQEVFDSLPVRDVVCWTTLITGYAEHGHDEEALACFKQMLTEGIPLDAVMLVCGLKVCCNVGTLHTGQDIHVEIERRGLLDRDLVVSNTLIHMYVKLGLVSKAQEVFDKLSVRNVFTWAILIAGYAEQGNSERALDCFEEMQHGGVIPDVVTYVCCLKACSVTGVIEKGMEIHAEVERLGLSQSSIILGNTLVEVYAKWGMLRQAQQVFDRLTIRNEDSWNALITGYADHEYGEEVVKCLEQMPRDGFFPNVISLVCGLKACGRIGAMVKGRELHGEAGRQGLLENDDLIGNSLVDMYSKCGLLKTAQEVFDHLYVRDVVSWNSLITGYAHFGETKSVFDIFLRMLEQNVRPDMVTFVVVLCACSRRGLVAKSQMYFEAMSQDYGIVSTPEHHAGIIDLFCRTGHLHQALTAIKWLPWNPNLVIWRTMLAACRSSGNVGFATEALKHVMHLDQRDSSAYILMSQTCIGADLHEKIMPKPQKTVPALGSFQKPTHPYQRL